MKQDYETEIRKKEKQTNPYQYEDIYLPVIYDSSGFLHADFCILYAGFVQKKVQEGSGRRP